MGLLQKCHKHIVLCWVDMGNQQPMGRIALEPVLYSCCRLQCSKKLERISYASQIRIGDPRIVQSDWRVVVVEPQPVAFDNCLRRSKRA